MMTLEQLECNNKISNKQVGKNDDDEFSEWDEDVENKEDKANIGSPEIKWTKFKNL